MFAIQLVFLIGTIFNVLNTHPHNVADVKAALVHQYMHPAISAGGPYNK